METLSEVFEKWRLLLEKWSTEFNIAAGIVFLLSCVLTVVHWIGKWYPNIIVLTGPKGCGKTMLFNQLKYVFPHMDTSNVGPCLLNTNTGRMRIVEVPRLKMFRYLHRTAGIVFVVDLTAILPQYAAISGYIYDLLTTLSVVQMRIPVLILFNKMDACTAHSMEFARKQIEREIGKILASKEVVGQAFIHNETFNFSQCVNKVKLAESSGLKGEIFELENFIRDCSR